MFQLVLQNPTVSLVFDVQNLALNQCPGLYVGLPVSVCEYFSHHSTINKRLLLDGKSVCLVLFGTITNVYISCSVGFQNPVYFDASTWLVQIFRNRRLAINGQTTTISQSMVSPLSVTTALACPFFYPENFN
jgi:cyanate permease